MFFLFLLCFVCVLRASDYSCQELIKYSFSDLAKVELVSQAGVRAVTHAPQYEVLVSAFLKDVAKFFSNTELEEKRKGKTPKEQFLAFLRVPEFKVFFAEQLSKKMSLYDLDKNFPQKNYFDVWDGRIFLGFFTPQYYIDQYLEDEKILIDNSKLVKEYKERALVVSKRVDYVLEKIRKELDSGLYSTSVPGYPLNDEEGNYYMALYLIEHAMPAELILSLTDIFNCGLPGRKEEALVQARYCIVLCECNNDGYSNQEIMGLGRELLAVLELLPTEFRAILIRKLLEFSLTHDIPEVIQDYIEHFRRIVDVIDIDEDLREKEKIFVRQLYCHYGQHDIAEQYV